MTRTAFTDLDIEHTKWLPPQPGSKHIDNMGSTTVVKELANVCVAKRKIGDDSRKRGSVSEKSDDSYWGFTHTMEEVSMAKVQSPELPNNAFTVVK